MASNSIYRRGCSSISTLLQILESSFVQLEKPDSVIPLFCSFPQEFVQWIHCLSAYLFSSLVTISAKVALVCKSLLEKSKATPQCLSSIHINVTAIKAALSYVYMLMNRDSNSHPSWSHGSLAESLDVALTGCTISFSLLGNGSRSTVRCTSDITILYYLL